MKNNLESHYDTWLEKTAPDQMTFEINTYKAASWQQLQGTVADLTHRIHMFAHNEYVIGASIKQSMPEDYDDPTRGKHDHHITRRFRERCEKQWRINCKLVANQKGIIVSVGTAKTWNPGSIPDGYELYDAAV